MVKQFKATMNKIDLQKAIILPFACIVFLMMLVVYFQIYTYTLLIAENTCTDLSKKIRTNIFAHIDSYLEKPEYINALNIALVQSKQLNINDEKQLGRIFLEEVKNSYSVDYAYYANEAGGIVSTGINKNQYTIATMKDMKFGDFAVNHVDPDGNFLEELRIIQGFDPRTRSWYKSAKVLKKKFWSEVYGGAQEPILGITASSPLLNANGDVVGVFGTDILLSKLSKYMQTLEISKNGSAYLVEPNGLLIASSTTDKLFFDEPDKIDRVNADLSTNPIITDSWRIVAQDIKMNDTFNFKTGKYKIAGQDYYLDISRYSYEENLNWYLVIAIPESDFTKEINYLFYNLTALMCLSLTLTLFFGARVAKWIINPIKILNAKVLDIRNGNWGIQIESNRSDVLGELTKSFNDMSKKLKDFYGSLIQKNNELEDLNANLEEIVRERTEKLRILSVTDELTGAYNHRYIMECLEQKIAESKRYSIPLSLVMFDIDFFKQVNDTYGHIEGNKVLIDVVACLKENTRGTDVLGRYGGEEFLLILPYTNIEQAYHIAERTRILISELRIGSMVIRVTTSGGVTEYRGESIEEFIRRVDQNLYQAKVAGRDRLVKK